MRNAKDRRPANHQVNIDFQAAPPKKCISVSNDRPDWFCPGVSRRHITVTVNASPAVPALRLIHARKALCHKASRHNHPRSRAWGHAPRAQAQRMPRIELISTPQPLADAYAFAPQIPDGSITTTKKGSKSTLRQSICFFLSAVGLGARSSEIPIPYRTVHRPDQLHI